MVARAYRIARRIVIAVVGSTVLLVGIILLVTPGPAFVVIPAGLAILALEFAWAKRWLTKAREMAQNAIQRKQSPPPPT
jgi:tellurite resistance protein TerC